jgi:hypothetical protein
LQNLILDDCFNQERAILHSSPHNLTSDDSQTAQGEGGLDQQQNLTSCDCLKYFLEKASLLPFVNPATSTWRISVTISLQSWDFCDYFKQSMEKVTLLSTLSFGEFFN